MPPLRTSLSAIKPVKTERTHEENQERAYIAASRRSDRSLEARVESARRASEIHKRRTGRSLRVTEQDVVNEEMYEEEDDDLPMQYRRLTAHLQTQNEAFNRRVNAYIVNQVAMRNAVGGGAGNPLAWDNQQFSPQGQFMNPGFMQMQQQGFQGSMMPPQQTYTQTPQNYRQQPYPSQRNMTNFQSMRQNYHGRSASIAVPVGQTTHHHHSPTAHSSPTETKHFDERRMSLPVQTNMPQTPSSQHGAASSPAHASPTISRSGSTNNLAHVKSESSPRSLPTPPEGSYQQQQPSPFGAAFDQQMMSGNIDPLSMQLPLNTQQHLFDAPSDLNMPQMFGQYTQPSYSYNPNGKPKAQPQNYDLNQTLSMPQLNTSFMNGFAQNMVSPQYTDSALSFTPQDNFGFNDFGAESFKSFGNGLDVSGQATPANEDWAGFLVDSASSDDLAGMAEV